MPKASNIKYIVIHCSAGFGSVESVKKFWKENLGWNSPGYHVFIDVDGESHELADYSKITNGVRGYNGESIHISYQGGVQKGDYSKAKDTRTVNQKLKIQHYISDVMLWIEKQTKEPAKIMVVGHRDFSKDQNANGVIEPFERMKECPSFDAMKEYEEYTHEDYRGKLP